MNKRTYVYANADEKYAKAIVLYANHDERIGSSAVLYYDAELKHGVKCEELMGLFIKGAVVALSYNGSSIGDAGRIIFVQSDGTASINHHGSVYTFTGINGVDNSPS